MIEGFSPEAIKRIQPMDDTWDESLRYYCQTSDISDPNLQFMAKMWSYSLSKGPLTGTQKESAERYITARHHENFQVYGFIPKYFPEWRE